jgi:LPLT family lysophospholipid transporter-like MFS transporter
MPKGFYFLIGAQFASGLADNALIILGIFFLQEQGYPEWWAPMLKFSLTLSYVFLASVVGPLADAFAKQHVMTWMNALKIGGIFLLLLGAQPMVAFAFVGLAASLYAPAKYGLMTESVPPHLLVRANAWLEVSMVLSVVLGIALGGALTGLSASGHVMHVLPAEFMVWLPFVTTQTLPAMLILLGIYLLAALLNLGLRHMRTRAVIVPLTGQAFQLRGFWKSNLQLWRDPLGGLSLYVTTLYWGVGAVLQFAVLMWSQQLLGLALQEGAFLQALVAVGVIVGAFWAGHQFKLHAARDALPWGLGLAILLPVIIQISNVWLAVPLLLCVGFSGGMLLVPMNALLQRRGMQVLSAGRSIAVQGFNENLSVLLMLASYSALLAFEVPLFYIMVMLAILLVAGILPLCLLRWR